MKIMVVDDEKDTEPLFIQRYKDEIKQGLFDFSFVSSAEDALKNLSLEDNPNAVLILSDINMPGMSGLQLLKTLKNKYPAVPVMMVTAYGDEANHTKAMAYKADGFVYKPIDFAALKEKMLKYSPLTFGAEAVGDVRSKAMATKILVVDDEPALEALIRQKFRQQIKNQELEFIFASNGKEALDIINEDEEIGIILTDINMPVMDGLTLLSKIKEKNRLFRTVVISAYGDMENIRTAMNLGASDFITKPIDLKDLATTLEKITEQFNSLKEAIIAQKRMIEYRKELEIASYIQQTFMPNNFKPFPLSEEVEIFGKMFSAREVSGDFFDFFPIGEDRLGFVIADVSGKGVPASLFMVMSKTLMRSAALANPSPKECLREVSHYLCYNNESAMFVTAFYGILDIKTGLVTYCDAGHLPPYILSVKGEMKSFPKNGGIALGVVDDLRQDESLYQEKTLQLIPGDIVFLYTDGITEAINKAGDLYPKERFEALIKKNVPLGLKQLVQAIKEDIEVFSNDENQYDDITVLGIKWNGPKA